MAFYLILYFTRNMLCLKQSREVILYAVWYYIESFYLGFIIEAEGELTCFVIGKICFRDDVIF